MKSLLHCLTWIAAIVLVFLIRVPLANAHPLGNFTINHYAGLQVARDGIGIDYVLDMAEIPAFQEIAQLDTNHNHKPDSTETGHYSAAKCDEISPHLKLQLNQQPTALSLNHSTVEFPPGVGGLAALRLTCDFQGATTALGADQVVKFEDNYYPQRLGWREITVVAKDVPIQSSSTATSTTNRLKDYPTDLLSSPLNQRQISFQINPSLPSSQPTAHIQTPSPNPFSQALKGRSNDAFTSLITLKQPNFPTIMVALVIAFVWGGLHALSPGHGKTVVGAYLVGSRSKVQDALFLGLTVTLTHTAGIFALGLVMLLSTSQFVLTEQLFPWLSLLSGVMVTVIGLNLFIRRLHNSQVLQNWTLRKDHATHIPVPHTHEHNHHPDQSHIHKYGHTHHGHNHNHGHDHAHSHLPPGADGSPITWSSILALGISGGLLPCPSALVVLLSAIAVGQVGLGLALVSAFSLGLAGALTGIGLILVYTKNLFEQLPLELPKSKMLPAMSALLMTLIGIGITTQVLFFQTL